MVISQDCSMQIRVQILLQLLNSVWIFITGGFVDVVTDSYRQKYIIETCHAGIQGDDLEDTAKYTGGHLGINKTHDKSIKSILLT